MLLKCIKYQHKRESNTHAINVTIKLVIKILSRDIKCWYIRESNTHAIYVIPNSVSWVTSRHIKYHCMRESNTHAINVTIKLVIKDTIPYTIQQRRMQSEHQG